MVIIRTKSKRVKLRVSLRLLLFLLLLRLQRYSNVPRGWGRGFSFSFSFIERLIVGYPFGHCNGEESLGLADGPALEELDDVASLELVIRVVGLVLLLLPHAPLVLWVSCQPNNLDGDGLVVGGAHHLPLHRLHGPYWREKGGWGRGWGWGGGEGESERGGATAMEEWGWELELGDGRELKKPHCDCVVISSVLSLLLRHKGIRSVLSFLFISFIRTVVTLLGWVGCDHGAASDGTPSYVDGADGASSRKIFFFFSFLFF